MMAYKPRDMSWYNYLLTRTVKDSNGCMIWQGAVIQGVRSGLYGVATINKRVTLVHRYIAFHNLVEGDLDLLETFLRSDAVAMHHCDVTLCVSPEHVEVSTQQVNMNDAITKGRFNAKGEANSMAKLTAEQVQAIRKEYKNPLITQKLLGQKYGITQSAVSNILNRKLWSKT